MDVFQHRIGTDQASQLLQLALQSDWVDDATTSFLIHDLSRMQQRIESLQAVFPKSCLHALAIKANPLVAVLRHAAQAGVGLEAASIEEVHLALAAGCRPERIVFDSPAKTVAEIESALELGVLLNANSLPELDRIRTCLSRVASTSRIGIRVNPECGAGSIAETSVASKSSKFGVRLSEHRRELIAAFETSDWLTGLHVHVGSQGCSLGMLADAAVEIQSLREQIAAASGRDLQFIDLGGGLPTAYLSDDTPPSPADYMQTLRQRAPKLVDGSLDLVTEFGRSVQAGCGVTFSKVEYLRPEQSMLITHVGADLLMRPAYMPANWKHEFALCDASGQLKAGPQAATTIAGPLCFSGDIIGRDVSLPAAEPGDWLVIRDTGAYTVGMWSRHCSRSIPLVLGFQAAASPSLVALRQAETPQSMVQFWS